MNKGSRFKRVSKMKVGVIRPVLWYRYSAILRKPMRIHGSYSSRLIAAKLWGDSVCFRGV